MLRRPAYLDFAVRNFPRAAFDLATSGIPTLAQAELGAASLDDPGGWDRLCSAIARHHELPTSEVAGALGASHGLWLALQAMLATGDEAVIEEPTYEPLLLGAESAGARIRRFDRGASVAYAVDPDRVLAATSPNTKVVAITNLHNPSGVRVSDDAMRAIANGLAARGAMLFVDEVYSPFEEFVGSDNVFRGSARRLAPNIVTTSSLTKAYGLGPQRVGWVLGPEQIVTRVMDAIVASVGVLPLSWMHRGVLAIDRVGALADRTRVLLGNKRTHVEAWMRDRPKLHWSRPEAGLFGFATVPDFAGDLVPIIERGIDTHGVIVSPGRFFGVPNGFRLAWSLPEEKLAEGLAQLDAVLRAADLI